MLFVSWFTSVIFLSFPCWYFFLLYFYLYSCSIAIEVCSKGYSSGINLFYSAKLVHEQPWILLSLISVPKVSLATKLQVWIDAIVWFWIWKKNVPLSRASIWMYNFFAHLSCGIGFFYYLISQKQSLGIPSLLGSLCHRIGNLKPNSSASCPCGCRSSRSS